MIPYYYALRNITSRLYSPYASHRFFESPHHPDHRNVHSGHRCHDSLSPLTPSQRFSEEPLTTGLDLPFTPRSCLFYGHEPDLFELVCLENMFALLLPEDVYVPSSAHALHSPGAKGCKGVDLRTSPVDHRIFHRDVSLCWAHSGICILSD